MDGIQPTYQLGSDNFGGNSFFWVFALLALMNGGFGLNGANALYGRTATVEDINNTSNFTRLESQVRANADLTERKVDGIANGLSSLGYEVAQQFGNTNTRMATGFCDMSKQILESRYLNSQEIAQAKSEILGAFAQNQIDSLRAQVNDLKMDNKLCGIPRINPSAYGVYPYTTGCGCNNI